MQLFLQKALYVIFPVVEFLICYFGELKKSSNTY